MSFSLKKRFPVVKASPLAPVLIGLLVLASSPARAAGPEAEGGAPVTPMAATAPSDGTIRDAAAARPETGQKQAAISVNDKCGAAVMAKIVERARAANPNKSEAEIRNYVVAHKSDWVNEDQYGCEIDEKVLDASLAVGLTTQSMVQATGQAAGGAAVANTQNAAQSNGGAHVQKEALKSMALAQGATAAAQSAGAATMGTLSAVELAVAAKQFETARQIEELEKSKGYDGDANLSNAGMVHRLGAGAKGYTSADNANGQTDVDEAVAKKKKLRNNHKKA